MIQDLPTRIRIGSVVRYFDIANQNRNAQVVMSLPVPLSTPSGRSLGMSDYGLRDLVTGETSSSDLRQHGWSLLVQ